MHTHTRTHTHTHTSSSHSTHSLISKFCSSWKWSYIRERDPTGLMGNWRGMMRNLPNRWTRWATNPSATAVCSEGVPAKEEKDRAGVKQQSKGLSREEELSRVHNMTLAPWASREKLFFHQSNCIPDVTIWLVGHWLMLTTLRWSRNQVYSSITLTLVMLCWHERHIVNQA